MGGTARGDGGARTGELVRSAGIAGAGDGRKRSGYPHALRGAAAKTAKPDGATSGFGCDAVAGCNTDLGARTAGALEDNAAGSTLLRPSPADGVAGELSGGAGLRGQFPAEVFPGRQPCGNAAARSRLELPAVAGACSRGGALGEHGTGGARVATELRGDLESGRGGGGRHLGAQLDRDADDLRDVCAAFVAERAVGCAVC